MIIWAAATLAALSLASPPSFTRAGCALLDNERIGCLHSAAEKSAALRIEPVHNAVVRPVDGGCGHLAAAIAHTRCAALLLPARATMLTTYGSHGPVLACLFAQATAL